MCLNLRISVCLTYIPNRGFQASGGLPQMGHRVSMEYVRIYSGPGLTKKEVPCSGSSYNRDSNLGSTFNLGNASL